MKPQLFFILLVYSISGGLVYSYADTLNTRPTAGCSSILPSDARTIGQPQLCHAKLAGQDALYACQDFTSRSAQYRVYFKSGTRARAIVQLAHQENAAPTWLETNTTQVSCRVPVPASLPVHAAFKGAGVCQDNNDQDVPCAVFRNRAPREKYLHDYLVLYHLDGSGPRDIESVYTGYNEDAFPAELAFQIGMSLLETRCCHKQGLAYIQQAYQMFPSSSLYRKSYQYFTGRALDKNSSAMTTSQID